MRMASPKKSTPLISAIVATIAIPSVLYFGLNSSGKNNKSYAKGANQGMITTNQENVPISTFPEANTGMVLLPFVGAVLVFSSLHLFRAKAAQKD
jgi:hypothetical protein